MANTHTTVSRILRSLPPAPRHSNHTESPKSPNSSLPQNATFNPTSQPFDKLQTKPSTLFACTPVEEDVYIRELEFVKAVGHKGLHVGRGDRLRNTTRWRSVRPQPSPAALLCHPGVRKRESVCLSLYPLHLRPDETPSCSPRPKLKREDSGRGGGETRQPSNTRLRQDEISRPGRPR
jgi:hypothetical protein